MLWAIGCMGWAAVGYVIIRYIVEKCQYDDHPLQDFCLGLIFPFVLIYIGIREIIYREQIHGDRDDDEIMQENQCKKQLQDINRHNKQQCQREISWQQYNTRQKYLQKNQNKNIQPFNDTFEQQILWGHLYNVIYYLKEHGLWFENDEEMYETPCLYWTLRHFYDVGQYYQQQYDEYVEKYSGYSLISDISAVPFLDSMLLTVPAPEDNNKLESSCWNAVMSSSKKYEEYNQELYEKVGQYNCHLIGFPENPFAADGIYTSPMRAYLITDNEMVVQTQMQVDISEN